MLAALLLNLGGGPPPPPQTAAAPRFGGGPFWRRYGYDEDYDDIREAAEEEVEVIELEPVVRRAAKAIAEAPQARRTEQIVIDAGAVYASALRRISADLEQTAAERKFERAVRKKLREQQQAEEEALILAFIELN